jgi:hypothetical protein
MKTTKLILAFFTAMLLATTTSFSQSTLTLTSDANFTVNYEGSKSDYLYFTVTLKDFANESKVLKINDKAEGELHRQFVDSKTTILTFKIEKNEGQVLSFNLLVGNKVYNKTFSFATKLIANLVVEEEGVASR